MKKSLSMGALSLLLLLLPMALLAQSTKTVKAAWKEGTPVELDLKFGNTIKVDGWQKDEVEVVARYSINGGRQDRIFVLERGSSVEDIHITADLDREQATDTRAADCPDHRMVYDGDKHYICAEIDYKVKVPARASVYVHTIDADIDADGINGAFHGKSISGFVDLSWPNRQGADVSLKTITGEAYSDLDLDLSNHRKSSGPVGYRLKGRIAGGGPELQLESISNNVYLRKN